MSLNALLTNDGSTNRTFLPNMMNYRGVWTTNVSYNPDDVVSDSGGNWWVATVQNINLSPSNYPTLSTWQPVGNSNLGGGGGGGGVASVTAGNAGITVGGTTTNPTVSNNGVLSFVAGSGLTNVGTSTAPNINANVLSVTGGTNVTVTNTSGNYAISAPNAIINPATVPIVASQGVRTTSTSCNAGTYVTTTNAPSSVWAGIATNPASTGIPQQTIGINTSGIYLIRLDSGAIVSLYTVAKGTGVAVAINGTTMTASTETSLLYTADTWTTTNVSPSNPPTGAKWTGVATSTVVATTAWAICSPGGQVYLSTDSGANYFAMTACPVDNYIVVASTGNSVYAMSGTNIVYCSVGGTLTSPWVTIYNQPTLPTGVTYSRISSITSPTGILVTTSAGVVYYVSSPTTSSAVWNILPVTGTFVTSGYGNSIVVGGKLPSSATSTLSLFIPPSISNLSSFLNINKWTIAPVVDNFTCGCIQTFSAFSNAKAYTYFLAGTTTANGGTGYVYYNPSNFLSLTCDATTVLSAGDTVSIQPSLSFSVATSFTGNGIKLSVGGTDSATNAITLGGLYIMASMPTSKTTYVRQPFITYGTYTAGSGASGNSGSITFPNSVVFTATPVMTVTMMDATPANMSVSVTSTSTFTIYWSGAGAGAHTIAWVAMGN